MPAKKLTTQQTKSLLTLLQSRFEKNTQRHNDIKWNSVLERMNENSEKLWSLQQMEDSGGEPDVVGIDEKSNAIIFYDCAAESPAGRRSICYDRAGLESRKEHKPATSAIDMAAEMGVQLLTEEQYRHLQTLGTFDAKTSSWVQTPAEVRKLGGALFCDYRYGKVFVYHNGAQSYYGGRGFRAVLHV